MSRRFLDILHLPERCVLEKRLTKAFFLKHFTLSASEKKLLNEGIEQMDWLASIKAAHVPAFVTATHSYEEVQFFAVQLRNSRVEQSGTKVADLLQKYLPYHLLLFVYDAENYLVNTCTKRINQNEASKRTMEANMSSPVLSLLYADSHVKAFHKGLRFEHLDKTDLRTLYVAYVQAIVQYRAAAITGTYRKRPAQRSEQDLADLQRIDALETEIRALQAKAVKDHPLREKVEVNMTIQRKRKAVSVLKNKLEKE